MQPRFLRLAIPALLLPQLLPAQEHDALNRFTLGARLPFNISAKFDHLGGFPQQTDPGPVAGSGLSRNYDDGYVRRDSEDSAGGVTWYWGYRDAAQVPGDDNLYLHSSSADASGSVRASGDEPELGAEIAWLRTLARNEKWSWGAKLAFNYTDIDICDSRSFSTPVTRLTDRFSLGGIIPPGDPSLPGWQYQGAYEIPGPVIDDAPGQRTSTTVPNGAMTTGAHEIAASIYGWKLGLWVDVPLNKRLAFNVGAGGAVGVVDSTFRFNETTAIAGVGAVTQNGSSSDTDAVLGLYAEAGFSYALTQSLGLFVTGEFQHLDPFKQSTGGRHVELDLGETWSLQTGVTFSF